MSLTFQLARGALAIALFAALSMTAWLAPSAPGMTRVIIISGAGVAATCPVPPPVLRLALSPADLPASHRSPGSCRA
jgi:hypothetical protein